MKWGYSLYYWYKLLLLLWIGLDSKRHPYPSHTHQVNNYPTHEHHIRFIRLNQTLISTYQTPFAPNQYTTQQQFHSQEG